MTEASYMQLDITDAEAVMSVIKDVTPDVIIHCAAWTAVDAAEDEENREKVHAINADGTRFIAEAAKAVDAKMIYISTDYVFDGQHTIEIVASESGSRETPVWCMIYDDLKYTEEAHIFADQQKHVKNLVPYETFIAHIEAGDEKQKMIEATVKSYGLNITNSQAINGICAISTLEKIYDRYGQKILDSTLRLAIATWEGETNSLSGNVLMGIAKIIVAYGDSLREDVFKDHVGKMSVKSIIRTARERRPGALGYSEAMMLAYNAKNKYHLSLKTLYGGKSVTNDPDEEYGIEN